MYICICVNIVLLGGFCYPKPNTNSSGTEGGGECKTIRTVGYNSTERGEELQIPLLWPILILQNDNYIVYDIACIRHSESRLLDPGSRILVRIQDPTLISIKIASEYRNTYKLIYVDIQSNTSKRASHRPLSSSLAQPCPDPGKRAQTQISGKIKP